MNELKRRVTTGIMAHVNKQLNRPFRTMDLRDLDNKEENRMELNDENN
jgi:hypothetical protein